VRFFLLLVVLCTLSSAAQAIKTEPGNTRLVVLISIDQLRGDSIDRIRDRLEPAGFRYFLERGFEFRNAHYRHAATVTAAGHATLATGTSSGTHGMVGNSWFDTSNNKRVYCVQDPNSRVHDEEFRKRAGSSPANLLVPTLGDELIRQLDPNTRVFSVSIKDRSAILMAGRGGKAFWLSRSAGLFTTSDYYYAHDAVPQWVHDFRRDHPLSALAGRSWELLHKRSSYRLGSADARSVEVPPRGWTTEFPHVLPHDAGKLVRSLIHSPMGDHYTLEFVEALLDGESLGRSNSTDMLAIGFSATDNIGHAFGPNSLEFEDNLLQIDRTLGRLLAMLDERIGLDRITLALAGDHGTDATPEFRRELCDASEMARLQRRELYPSILDPEHPYADPKGPGCEAGRHDPAVFLPRANAAMQRRFEVSEDLVISYRHPNLYLDETAVAATGLELEEVSQALADFMGSEPGFALVLTRAELSSTKRFDDPRIAKMRSGFHPRRSGHVVLTTERFWYLYQNPHTDASMHGSPYVYDTHVPILLVGAGIRRGSSERSVAPSDIAPTLARVMGIEMPQAQGSPLLESLVDR